jgi:hypothetical protein
MKCNGTRDELSLTLNPDFASLHSGYAGLCLRPRNRNGGMDTLLKCAAVRE